MNIQINYEKGKEIIFLRGMSVHNFLRVILNSSTEGDIPWGYTFVEKEGGSLKRVCVSTVNCQRTGNRDISSLRYTLLSLVCEV